jgi:hypothetical protein
VTHKSRDLLYTLIPKNVVTNMALRRAPPHTHPHPHRDNPPPPSFSASVSRSFTLSSTSTSDLSFSLLEFWRSRAKRQASTCDLGVGSEGGGVTLGGGGEGLMDDVGLDRWVKNPRLCP